MSNKLKILIVGGPCSGKTTLCKKLSEMYETIFIDEILMKYMLDNKLESKDVTLDIIINCIKLQAEEENKSFNKVKKILFCEGTSFSALKTLYSQQLIDIIQMQLKDCNQIFLCDNNIPYINTKVRPDYDLAQSCHKAIVDYLKDNNLNYILLSGSLKERIKIVNNVINDIVNKNEIKGE